MTKTKFGRPMTFIVSDEFRARIEKKAKARKLNTSEFIRLAIENEMRGYRAVILQGTDTDIRRTVDAFVRSAQKTKSTP